MFCWSMTRGPTLPPRDFSISLLWDSESVAMKTERAAVLFAHSPTALRISGRSGRHMAAVRGSAVCRL